MQPWQPLSFDLAGISISALHCGKGDNLLICFHGYQQTKELFLPVFETIPENWQILTIDQPLHGQTIWDNSEWTWGLDFFPKFWELIEAKLSYQKVTILGFSMGGKTAMGMCSRAKKPLERLILIAPGGVKTHPLETFFSYHKAGQALFKLCLRHHQPFLSVMDFAYQRKLIHKFQHRFVRAQFAFPDARTKMKAYLRIYPHFNIHPELLKEIYNTTKTQFFLVWGTNDTVTTYDRSAHFLQLFPRTQFFSLNQAKHNVLEENLAEVQQLLKQIL
ncbi:MAG: alpha/beta fold hydrolase [Bacteroidia bacterium]